MTDKMPLYITRQFSHFGGEFLWPILPESSLPGIIGLKDIFSWVEFGNCHQFNLWRQFRKNTL